MHYSILLILFLILSLQNPLSAQLTQIGQPILPDSHLSVFGYPNSIDISNNGKRIIIGVTYSSNHSTTDTSNYKVYEWQDTAWIQKGQTIYTINDIVLSDRNVAMSGDGNRFVISIPFYNGPWPESGLVQVYEWQDTSWVQLGNNIYGQYYGANRGYRVSINRNGTVIALKQIPNTFNPQANPVDVLQWNGSSWQAKGSPFTGIDTTGYMGQGLALSDDGNSIAIGTPQLGVGTSTADSGYVKVFDWNGNTWLQRGNTLRGDSIDSHFGRQVSLSKDGQIMAISNEANGNINSGYTKVFEWTGNTWTQRGNTFISPNVMSQDLNADGSTLAITEHLYDSQGETNRGILRIYDWSGVQWQIRPESILGETAYDHFGRSVKLDSTGRTVIAASSNKTALSTTGRRARIFRYCQPGTINTQTQLEGSNLVALQSDAYFHWLDCDNSLAEISQSSDSIFTPQQTGSYAVAIQQMGCRDTSACIQIIGSSVLYHPSSTEKIYPNPTTKHINIELPTPTAIDIQLFDVQGRLLLQKRIIQSTQVDLSDFSAGLYFLVVKRETGVQTYKVLKE